MGLGSGLRRAGMALAAFKNGWFAAGAPEGPTNGIPAASLSRGVWVFTRNPWSSPLSPHGLLQLQAPCRPQFLLLSSGKGLTWSGDLGSAWTPRAQILGSKRPPYHQPAPPLPPQLPPPRDTFAAGKVNPLQFKGSVPRWQ